MILHGVLLIVMAAPVTFAETTYTITDLGTLGGTNSSARAINISGQVVGYASTSNGAVHAFLYSNGDMTDLGALGGTESRAWGINAGGQVVGFFTPGAIDFPFYGFLYSNGQMTNLGTLPGGTVSVAGAINSSGQIVGASNFEGHAALHAFLLVNGIKTNLGTLGGTSSQAMGINESGQIVGVSDMPGDNETRPFLYHNGQWTNLGSLGGTQGYAHNINDSGQIVGFSYTTGDTMYHAFLYDQGHMTNLGTLGGANSSAFGINNPGQVVGTADTAAGASHAFLYYAGTMTDLNDRIAPGSGWVLNCAYGINLHGLIVGEGTTNGVSHAFLLTPILPQLAIANGPGINIIVSWNTNYPGFMLESTDGLTGGWVTVPGVTGYSATVPVTNDSQFFRLVAIPNPNPARLVWIPAGTFLMGSPATEQDRLPDEGPQTQVTLAKGFFIGVHEVTQAEYAAVTGINPSAFIGDTNRPVEQVSWSDATNFCRLLTEQESAAGKLPSGYEYRLPTEAEWEYACRAGTTTRFYYGDDPGYSQLADYAWYDANSSGTTHPAGQKQPNGRALYDLSGNVWEWCSDWYGAYSGGAVVDPQGPASSSNGRVIRGGSWFFGGWSCRSAQRHYSAPTNKLNQVGFRVVLGSKR